MTTSELTALLAQRVMGWTVAPGRYLMKNRQWTPAWRFQPIKNLEDAFRLLAAADTDEYRITSRCGGDFIVRVVIDGTAGEAYGNSQPRVITLAIARAIGLDPDGRRPPKTGPEHR